MHARPSRVSNSRRGTKCVAPSAARVVLVLDWPPKGFRLFSIREGSAWDRLGLKSGDTITALDDVPLTSAEQAKKALASVKGCTHSWVDLDRNGVAIRLDYVVEEAGSGTPKRAP